MKARSRKMRQLLKEFENNHNIEIACKKVGIARSTYYRWIEQDDPFRAECEYAQDKGRARTSDYIESKLLENAKDGHHGAITYWLSHNTARYRAYPKNVYTDEIKQLRIHRQAYDDLIGLLINDRGYESVQRFIRNMEDTENKQSPLDQS